MNQVKKLLCTLRSRWRAKTPLIFSRIIKLSVGIGITAAAIQTTLISSGAEIPDWWLKVLPYLIGAGAGASAVAQLTQQYDQDHNPIEK